MNCTRLISAAIPESVIEIEEGAFAGCSSLLSVTIPDSVVTIRKRAFAGCTGIKQLTMPIDLSYVAKSDKFESVSFIDADGKVGTLTDCTFKKEDSSFYDCTNITEIILTKGYTGIGHDYSNAGYDIKPYSGPSSPMQRSFAALERAAVKEGVTRVGNNTFRGCGKLSEITFAEGLTSIGSGALDGTAITRMTLPDSFESFED